VDFQKLAKLTFCILCNYTVTLGERERNIRARCLLDWYYYSLNVAASLTLCKKLRLYIEEITVCKTITASVQREEANSEAIWIYLLHTPKNSAVTQISTGRELTSELPPAVPRLRACRDPSGARVLWGNGGEKKCTTFSQCREHLTVREAAHWYWYFQTARRSISSIVYFWSYGCVCLGVLDVHISVLILRRSS